MPDPLAVPDHAGPSLWDTVTPPGPDLPALEGAVEADLVVIGGGFTGLSAALAAAEAGRRVVLLEAGEPGAGASGRNNGQVIPTLTRPDPDDLVKRWGEAGERFVHLLRDSGDVLFELARRHAIPEAEQTGWIQPAHTPGRLRISERRATQWARHGARVALLSRAEVRERTGSEAWFGGFTVFSGGHVNPLALARGLARAALAAGATLHAHTPATGYRHDGTAWQVTTPRGRVTAGGLVLATGTYTGEIAAGLAPDIARQVVPVLSWQMATEPVSDNLRGVIIPGRQAVSDTHGDLWFMRYDARGRLVTGGALVVPVDGADKLRHRIGARLRHIFPQLGEVTFPQVWNGYIGMTPDYHPRLHRLGPQGYGWIGCNGRAVALAVSLGRELARAALGTDERDLALPLEPVRPIPLQGLARRVAPLKLLEYRWRDGREI